MNRVYLSISDPQRLTMPEWGARRVVNILMGKGVDPHEFATAYTNRTVELGYAPSLIMSAKEFLGKKLEVV